VKFKQNQFRVSLPESAELCTGFRGRRYLRRHGSNGFLVFSVDVNQQIADPKQR
jgi:hypothetical protein